MKIHAIETGKVKVKEEQRVRESGGIFKVLTSKNWSPWLPIFAWVIEHDEGLIVVDTGETSNTSASWYFPAWHPYFRYAVAFKVEPEDEIGPQMYKRGLNPNDVKQVVMTHLHTDHAGGMGHFPGAMFHVAAPELAATQGFAGKLAGYVAQHWPPGINWREIEFNGGALGPFSSSFAVTQKGDVRVVETPGHSPGHVSVVVDDGDVSFLLAGDTSYTQETLQRLQPDGVMPKPEVGVDTMKKILALGRERPLVYLPSHDPDCERRLAEREPLPTQG